MIHSLSQLPSDENGWVTIFETPIDALAGFIRAHTVGGFNLCPASVYIERVLAGITFAEDHLALSQTHDRVILQKIEFIKPLLYVEEMSCTVKTNIMLQMDGSGTFIVSSRLTGTEGD